jgi:hypothetical protein
LDDVKELSEIGHSRYGRCVIMESLADYDTGCLIRLRWKNAAYSRDIYNAPSNTNIVTVKTISAKGQ